MEGVLYLKRKPNDFCFILCRHTHQPIRFCPVTSHPWVWGLKLKNEGKEKSQISVCQVSHLHASIVYGLKCTFPNFTHPSLSSQRPLRKLFLTPRDTKGHFCLA